MSNDNDKFEFVQIEVDDKALARKKRAKKETSAHVDYARAFVKYAVSYIDDEDNDTDKFSVVIDQLVLDACAGKSSAKSVMRSVHNVFYHALRDANYIARFRVKVTDEVIVTNDDKTFSVKSANVTILLK